MDKVERIREEIAGPMDVEYLKKRAAEGWRLAAIEWQRPAEGREAAPESKGLDVPYGIRVAGDCSRMEENPAEMEALTLILESIVQDRSLFAMAEALNQRGFRTRDGSKWTVVSVYNMLPRLIELSPRIFTKEDWMERRKQITVAG